MRILRAMANAGRGRTSGLLARRVARGRPAVERLEERALLSGVWPARAASDDLPGKLRGAHEVAALGAAHTGGRSIALGEGPGASAQAPHAGSGAVHVTSSARGSGGGGVTRRSALQMVSARDLLDPLAASARRPDPTSPGDPGPVNQSEGGPTGESAAVSLIGWAPVVASAPDLPAGFGNAPPAPSANGGARGGSLIPTGPSGSFGIVAHGLETGAAEVRTWSPPGDGEPHELSTVTAVAGPGASAPDGPPLLDGALPADWESIDREMRRLLAGAGGLADPPGGPEAGPGWLLWIGTAAAAYLAHRASSGRRGPSRRSGRRAAPTPIPVGPWPLGPP